MLASDARVPVTILRELLTFEVLWALLHKVMLNCELFQGQAKLTVRPAFPIEGILVILCNNLAGDRVWTDDHLQ